MTEEDKSPPSVHTQSEQVVDYVITKILHLINVERRKFVPPPLLNTEITPVKQVGKVVGLGC